MDPADGTDRLREVGGVAVLSPAIASRYPGLTIVHSTRRGGGGAGAFRMNISYNVGDDPSSVDRNREIFWEAAGIPPAMVATTGQVHGSRVIRVEAPGHNPGCDGLITDREGLFLCVTVADCLAVFLFDPVRGVYGVVHAGWRGSRAEIVRVCAELLTAEYGSDPGDLVSYIGPGAASCCYEVGPEVAGEFPEEYTAPSGNARYRLDLASFNRDLLVKAGVRRGLIDISPGCTIHGRDLFHSFRRDGKESGRMMGVIGYHPG